MFDRIEPPRLLNAFSSLIVWTHAAMSCARFLVLAVVAALIFQGLASLFCLPAPHFPASPFN